MNLNLRSSFMRHLLVTIISFTSIALLGLGLSWIAGIIPPYDGNWKLIVSGIIGISLIGTGYVGYLWFSGKSGGLSHEEPDQFSFKKTVLKNNFSANPCAAKAEMILNIARLIAIGFGSMVIIMGIAAFHIELLTFLFSIFFCCLIFTSLYITKQAIKTYYKVKEKSEK